MSPACGARRADGGHATPQLAKRATQRRQRDGRRGQAPARGWHTQDVPGAVCLYALNSLRPYWLRDPPHRWRAGTLDREALKAQAAQLAASPGFVAVAKCFAQGWLRTQAEHAELRAVFRNTQRYLMLVAILVLHHRRVPGDPTSGLTPGRLIEFFESTASAIVPAGAGQVKAMLAHARLHGLVQPAPPSPYEPRDMRQRRLEPTPLLRRTMRSWVAGFMPAIENVATLPLPVASATLLDTPGVVPEMFAYRMAAMKEDRFVLLEGLDGMRWVLAHTHGYRVFQHLVMAAEPLPDGGARVPLTPTQLAASAGVSRGTVRNLLRDASAQGWFEDDAQAAGALWLRAQGWSVAQKWVARELVWMHGLVVAAYERQVAAAPVSPAAALAGGKL